MHSIAPFAVPASSGPDVGFPAPDFQTGFLTRASGDESIFSAFPSSAGLAFRSWAGSLIIDYLGIMRATMAPRFLALVIGLWLLAGSAAAQPLYDTPMFDPVSGHYFELVRVKPGHATRGPSIAAASWQVARRLAASRMHNGVRGRLAVVRSQHIADFLRETFRPDHAAWIGLRYWCRFNKLQWVTGEFYKRGEYSDWRGTWNVSGGRPGGPRVSSCSKRRYEYWPVHYWSMQDGFYWNANGTQKNLYAFFLEYPAESQ